jgi:predicted transcriptional regulator of viral defense system
MNKTEQIHKEILKEIVVNSRDLNDISKKVLGRVDRNYLYWKYINKLINENKVGKIKRGLYYGIPLDQIGEDYELDRYILASKIERGFALGYHTALELHGCAYSAFNDIYILIKKHDRFRSFKFQNVTYYPVITKYHNNHLVEIKYKKKKVIVTDPARTFVDCLSRVELCGGWEECLKSLANLRGILVPDVLDILELYKNETLKLKTGYLLELFSKKSPYYRHVGMEELRFFHPSGNWVPVYIDRDVPSELKKKWGLYVPQGFEDLLRGI